MYTLQQAKQEIDEIAKHAMDIAAHAISMGETYEAKIEGFRREVIGVIEGRFADLEKSILGDTQTVRSTAIADLGAKVSLLMHGTPAHAADVGDAPSQDAADHQTEHPHDGHQQHDHDQHDHQHDAPHHDAPHEQHGGDHNQHD